MNANLYIYFICWLNTNFKATVEYQQTKLGQQTYGHLYLGLREIYLDVIFDRIISLGLTLLSVFQILVILFHLFTSVEITSCYGCEVHYSDQVLFQSSSVLYILFLPHVRFLQQVQSAQGVQQGQGVHVHHSILEHPVCQAHPEVDKK